MQMNSKNLLSIKNKLKKYLKDKDILDIILFGSFVKGKAVPNDIDIAIISNKKIIIEDSNFHVSLISLKDFFVDVPSIIHTLFREGYSLKNNKSFSEIYKFKNKVLFKYDFSGLIASEKVKIVNILRGKGKEKGSVESESGEWLANQVFFIPVEKEELFDKFFRNFKVKYKKFYLLMH